MTGLGDEILWPLLRATVLLAVSAVLVQGLIWWLRPNSPRIQRAGWFLVLLQGVVLFHLPVTLAWVEPRPPQPPANAAADFSGIPLVSYSRCTTGKVTHSQRDHIWSVRPAAMAGVCGSHWPSGPG